MSIPCNNLFRCTSDNPQTLSAIEKWLSANIPDFCDVEMSDNHTYLNFNLDHDYGFPAASMKQMTSQLPADDSLTISVLTYDSGHEYIAHHEYKNCKWHRLYENTCHPIAERL